MRDQEHGEFDLAAQPVEKSDDPGTVIQIRQLLHPFEYTKVDNIIDVIFTTAVDVESQLAEEKEKPEAADAVEAGWLSIAPLSFGPRAHTRTAGTPVTHPPAREPDQTRRS